MTLRNYFVRALRMPRTPRRLLSYLLDVAAFALSGFLAFNLRFDGALPPQYFRPMGVALCIWAVAKFGCFVVLKVDWRNARYTSAADVVRVVLANTAGSIVSAFLLIVLVGQWGIPRSVYIIDCLIACLLTSLGRLAVRAINNKIHSAGAVERQPRTLIYGAGAAGIALLLELQQNQNLKWNVIGLIDDDSSKVGLILFGRQVLGTGKALETLARKHDIEKLLIAVPSATGSEMARILRFAIDSKLEYKMVPGLGELLEGRELGKQIRDVSVEDLLGRSAVHLDVERIKQRIQGRVVMVTGAAGSIGSEICRQIAHFRPLGIVGFDEAETPLFHLDREMRRSFPDIGFYPEIGNITRPDTLKLAMQRHAPTILYHAAAYKHVPLMEQHMFAAVETNIVGTWNVACTAAENGVEDFVMISTDKAVRPTSMMGATKRIAELIIRALQKTSGTKFVAVRFGNVLGSNGSVVPIFKEQIAAGGPVTVTHPEMRRYFMTIPEASQLVLQAFSLGQGGEIFVLDMGEPVKITDLAKNLILLSGLQPERDIQIQYTGLRPGEKLFEELNLQDEELVETAHPKIRSYVGNHNPDIGEIVAFLLRLQKITEERNVGELVLLLKEKIPDYNPGSQLLKMALSIKPSMASPKKLPVTNVQTETQTIAKPAPLALVN